VSASRPTVRSIVHALRNLAGPALLDAERLQQLLASSGLEREARLARDIAESERFTGEVLRVVEFWDSDEAVAVDLGAWAWAWQFLDPDLRMGTFVATGRVEIVVGPALAAAERMLAAVGRGLGHTIESTGDGGVVLFAPWAARDPAGLTNAIHVLRAAGVASMSASTESCLIRMHSDRAFAAPDHFSHSGEVARDATSSPATAASRTSRRKA